MKQPFPAADLKDALERALGFGLASLERLDGASALNFKAVRETDSLAFAVKCTPPARRDAYLRLLRHLEETRGTKAVRRLFEKECPAEFRGYLLVCLSWCEGVRLFPDELSSEQFAAFLKEYLAFSAAMQKATMIAPPDPIAAWRAAAAGCRGFFAAPIRRLAEREMPADETAYRPERLGVIHGDFHHGNFLFVDGRLSGFFDLEEFCGGYPADDIVRYFVCAAEHLRWYEWCRRRALVARFSEAVRLLPYPAGDWRTAVNGLLARKIYMKLRDRGPGFFQTLNLLYRSRFYIALKRRV
ncbi:MAG: aminoglycoside phosphotransferase family protein [Kiritimatiellae bacterium]|nr:aminoglycoside phosphotransferase family protein [Kiritimatiellia bacterium]